MFFGRLAEAPAGDARPSPWLRWLPLLLFAVFVFQVAQVVHGYYLDSDDWFLLEMGREVCALPKAEHLLRFWTAEPTWRPVLTARAALEWCLWGDAAFPRYVLTAALHGLCGWLVGAIAGAMGYGGATRVLCALLYVAHPIHAEALGWHHSGFEGVTVDALVLLSVLAWAKGRPWVSLIWLQAALLTRENALVVVPVIAALAALRSLPGWRLRAAWSASWPAGVLVLVNVAGRLLLLANTPGRDTAGSFHLVESPLSALVTTLLHPWVPVHPALGDRQWLWAVFASVPVLLLAVGGRAGARVLWGCLGLYLVLAAPFLPVFHEATRFLEAAPGGLEQRWYFFHLPVAALVVWPAVVIARQEQVFARVLSGVALVALLLIGQLLNIGWWQGYSRVAERVADQMRAAVVGGATAVGLRADEGSDTAEVANQIFLNAPSIVGRDARRGLRVFHSGAAVTDEVQELRGGRYDRHWGAPLSAPPRTIRWWGVDERAGELQQP